MTRLNLSYQATAEAKPAEVESNVESTLASLSSAVGSGMGSAMASTAAPSPSPGPAAAEPEAIIGVAGDWFEVSDAACPKEYIDQFQLLRTQLLLHKTRISEFRDLRTIAVMSTLPGEGKSFTARNVAMALAAVHGGQSSKQGKVLLIRSSMTREEQAASALTAPWDDRGLVQAMADFSRWKQCIRRVPGAPLYVMPRGALRSISPISSVNYEPLPELLSTLHQHFDWIVLDGVSFGTSPDAAWFSQACDGTLLVVGQSAPGFGGLNDALGQIAADRLVGLVMNKGITPHKRAFRVRIRLGRKAV